MTKLSLPLLQQCPFFSIRTHTHVHTRTRAHSHTQLTASLPQLTSLDLARCKNSSISLREVWTRGTRRGAEEDFGPERGAESPGSGRLGRSDQLLLPAARRRQRLKLSPQRWRPRVPSPTPALLRPLWASDSALLRKVGVPPGDPGRALQAHWHAPAAPELKTWTRGRLCWGMARGYLANRRALLRPPDAARLKLLQPWTAPRSASQVQGAAAEGSSAAGTLSARGRWEEGEWGKAP